MQIEGTVALVTGSNRGLGAAIVTALLERGAAKVYAAARDATKVVVSSPRVVPLALDVTRPAEIAAAAVAASDVSLLINNAGVLTSYDVLGARREDLERDFGTNVHGTREMIQAFVPVLERARDGATIVNVLSMAALASFPALGGYSASKAAAYSMTQALRPALRARRIALVAALPGPIDTDMVRALPMAKTPPADVARALIAGIVRGDEDLFPDPVAQQMGALYQASPRELARLFAAM